MRIKWVLWGLLALPAAEILIFVVLWARIGFLPTFGLALATSLLGAAVLKNAGGLARRMGRAPPRPDRARGGERGWVVSLAGLLLLLPGFLTDAVGLALLMPPVRDRIGRRFSRMSPRPAKTPRGATVDLDPGEWRRLEPRDPPHAPSEHR